MRALRMKVVRPGAAMPATESMLMGLEAGSAKAGSYSTTDWDNQDHCNE